MEKHFLYHFFLKSRSKLPSSKELILLLTVLAIVSFKGLKRMRIPENLGYERATITAIEVQKHIGLSGYQLSAQLADGEIVTAPRPFLRPTDNIGGEICLRRMRNKGRAGVWYQAALAYKCATSQSVFALAPTLS